MPWFARACPRRLTNRSEVPSTLIDVKQVLQQVRNRSVEQHGGKSFLVFFSGSGRRNQRSDGGTVVTCPTPMFPKSGNIRWTPCPVDAVKSCTRRRRTPLNTPTRHAARGTSVSAALSSLHAARDPQPEGVLHDGREDCKDDQQDDHKNDQARASRDDPPTATTTPSTPISSLPSPVPLSIFSTCSPFGTSNHV